MLRYVLRRFLTAIPTLFVIVTISFFLMRVAPGGPFNQEKGLNPVIKDREETLLNPRPATFDNGHKRAHQMTCFNDAIEPSRDVARDLRTRGVAQHQQRVGEWRRASTDKAEHAALAGV